MSCASLTFASRRTNANNVLAKLACPRWSSSTGVPCHVGLISGHFRVHAGAGARRTGACRSPKARR